MRHYTVTKDGTVTAEYTYFDRNPAGAAFKLIPASFIETVDGAFYCSADDIDNAHSEVARYAREQFNDTGKVRVTGL